MKTNLKNIKRQFSILFILLVGIFSLSVISANFYDDISVNTSSTTLSNKKIEWGIQRKENHEQPDVGKANQELISKYNGISMGNKDQKFIYLTFDMGYEAGYTEKILDTLKEKNVNATFFVTAHYINTASDLVQRMIDEGHIVGNHTPISLMSGNDIKVNARVIAYLEQIKTIKVFEKCMNEKLNISTYE